MAEQLPARSGQSAQDAHEDLLAALAASRELGPEMDATLAERYLEKHGKAGAAAPLGAPQSGIVARTPSLDLTAIMPILGAIAYIVLLLVSGGAYWWTFFIIPMMFGGGWWWGGSHDATRDARWQQRYDQRRARQMSRDQYRAWRHGYPYPYAQNNDDPRQAAAPGSDARVPSDVN